MIIVIADDITGAAELGGIGLRYGLKVLLADDVSVKDDIDLLVVYTNTRSASESEAVHQMHQLTRKAKALNPSLFYKKCDSVLRGHVLAEMKEQMQVFGFPRALLVPVNPALGRAIWGGNYFVNGVPVDQTSFRDDPEYPVTSSRIMEMLGTCDKEITALPANQSFPETGIVVGEAGTDEEVEQWTVYEGNDVLYVGGAAFFNALLAKRFEKKNVSIEFKPSHPLLVVSGTKFKKANTQPGYPEHVVSYMPETIFSKVAPSKEDYAGWCNEIATILKKYHTAVVAIGDRQEESDPEGLRKKQSEVVNLLFREEEINELWIEGGSTAYAVIQRLNWKSFYPTEELTQGVIRMKVADKQDIHVTIKPGSYNWPASSRMPEKSFQ